MKMNAQQMRMPAETPITLHEDIVDLYTTADQTPDVPAMYNTINIALSNISSCTQKISLAAHSPDWKVASPVGLSAGRS